MGRSLEDINADISRAIQGQAAQGKWSKAQTDNMMGYAGVGGVADVVNPEEIGSTVKSLQDQNLPAGSSLNQAGVTVPINRKYTQEEVKMLASAEALTGEVSELMDMVKTDEQIFREAKKGGAVKGLMSLAKTAQGPGSFPLGGMTERGQQYATTRKDVGERILRLRSGAQINENEYKRFMDLLPKIWRSDKVDLKQLGEFKKEFEGIMGRVKGGARWDDTQSKFLLPDGSDFSKQAVSAEDEMKAMSTEELTKLAGGK